MKKVVKQTEASVSEAKKSVKKKIAPVVKQVTSIKTVTSELKNPAKTEPVKTEDYVDVYAFVDALYEKLQPEIKKLKDITIIGIF